MNDKWIAVAPLLLLIVLALLALGQSRGMKRSDPADPRASSPAAAPAAQAGAKPIEALQIAAQGLRGAARDLAREPSSARRVRTIREIDQALRETQQAMIDLGTVPVTGDKAGPGAPGAGDAVRRRATGVARG